MTPDDMDKIGRDGFIRGGLFRDMVDRGEFDQELYERLTRTSVEQANSTLRLQGRQAAALVKSFTEMIDLVIKNVTIMVEDHNVPAQVAVRAAIATGISMGFSKGHDYAVVYGKLLADRGYYDY